MKFDELDEKMRVFETAHDYCVIPGLYIVARLDGRSFTRLTKKKYSFDVPFDERVRNHMVETARHVMDCGFNVIYGYTESDEISLLFHPDEDSFGRKTRKIISILSGEASGKFSILLGDSACFDCRLSLLPSVGIVTDYFRWRNEDAHRNALSSYCYWLHRKQGKDAKAATKALLRMSVAHKNELLFQNGINFNEVPNWQKRGVGLYWEVYAKEGKNPITGELAVAQRRRIRTDLDLPMGDEYSRFVADLITEYASGMGA